MSSARTPATAAESADRILSLAAGLEADGNAAILEGREVSTRLVLEAAAKVDEIAPEGLEVDVPPRPAVTRVEHTLDEAGQQRCVVKGSPERLVARLLRGAVVHRTDVLIGDADTEAPWL